MSRLFVSQPTSPLAKLEQRRSSSFDALQLVAETESPEKLPRSQSLTTLNEATAQPPSSINKTLSLPAGEKMSLMLLLVAGGFLILRHRGAQLLSVSEFKKGGNLCLCLARNREGDF